MNDLNPSPNRRVLIIDDNHAIHEDFRKILAGPTSGTALDEAEAALFGETAAKTTRAEFEIDSAFQGQEGLERVRQSLVEKRPYAMAFVDVRMPPGWDGVETIARIWEIYPDLQVVMCTAYSDYSWDEMIAKVGQSDRLVILKKPFDNVEALQLANALISKWQLLQQTRSHVLDLEERIHERTAEIENAHTKLRAEVDERNRMELQLRHAQKLESIGQLAAGIAHEINTPTQFIGDNLRFLRDSFQDLLQLRPAAQRLLEAARGGTVPADLVLEVGAGADKADVDYLCGEIPKALNQALEGVERVTKIVRSMKEFSHPGVTEKQKLDLNHAIESTITVASNEWKYVADLTTDFDPALPAVPVLPGEFNQVVLNIVVNAAHAIADVVGNAGHGKGRIHLTTRSAEGWAEIRITDSGTGIPETARARVFDPFFTTKGVGKGTGQGLAISHNVVVEKHGGTLTFETEMGRGTTFIIRLPIEEPAEATLERQAA